MKYLFIICAVLSGMTLYGCAVEEEEADEQQRTRARPKFMDRGQVQEDFFDEAGEESLFLIEKLEEGMTYEEVYRLFGYEGDLKMNVTGAGGTRKVYQWYLAGDVRVRVTFDDGESTKWDVQ